MNDTNPIEHIYAWITIEDGEERILVIENSKCQQMSLVCINLEILEKLKPVVKYHYSSKGKNAQLIRYTKSKVMDEINDMNDELN